MEKVHSDLKKKLSVYINEFKVPHLLFYGPSGAGKRSLVQWFVNTLYNKDELKNYVLTVDCAQGKGIKFIRSELKFFAKTNIHYSHKNHLFKSIILFNSDKLTIDAQSALRRCIELFSHKTRFFLVVEDKLRLLNPIISRFCEMHVPYPEIDGKQINLHSSKTLSTSNIKSKEGYLKNKLKDFSPKSMADIYKITDLLYDKAYMTSDLINYINNLKKMEKERKIELLILIDKMKQQIKSEKILISFIVMMLFFRYEESLENIIHM